MAKKILEIDETTIAEFLDLQIFLIKPYAKFKPEILKQLSNHNTIEQILFFSIISEIQIPPLPKKIITKITELANFINEKEVDTKNFKKEKLEEIVDLIDQLISRNIYKNTSVLKKNIIYQTLPKRIQNKIFHKINLREIRNKNYDDLIKDFFMIVDHIEKQEKKINIQKKTNITKKITHHKFIQLHVYEIKIRLELLLIDKLYAKASDFLHLKSISMGIKRSVQNEENPFLLQEDQQIPDHLTEINDSIFARKSKDKISKVEQLFSEIKKLLASESFILSENENRKIEQDFQKLQLQLNNLKINKYFGDNISQTFVKWLKQQDELNNSDSHEELYYFMIQFL